jgi:general secretion pathway protein G
MIDSKRLFVGEDRCIPIRRDRGYTLIELLLVTLIIGILAGIAIPTYINTIDQARNVRAIGEIKNLEKEIMTYQQDNDSLPDNLAQASPGGNLDPWGNPYQYLNFANAGAPRVDAFLIPLNSTFDLYSMGKDGLTAPALTAGQSWDDIVRGNDGGFFDKASKY